MRYRNVLLTLGSISRFFVNFSGFLYLQRFCPEISNPWCTLTAKKLSIEHCNKTHHWCCKHQRRLFFAQSTTVTIAEAFLVQTVIFSTIQAENYRRNLGFTVKNEFFSQKVLICLAGKKIMGSRLKRLSVEFCQAGSIFDSVSKTFVDFLEWSSTLGNSGNVTIRAKLLFLICHFLTRESKTLLRLQTVEEEQFDYIFVFHGSFAFSNCLNLLVRLSKAK